VFTLSSDHFEQKCPETFRRIWEDYEFTDVTLATEDGGQVQAHKVILSSCSSFFRKLFLKDPQKSSLVFLMGVELAPLSAVLQYIYQGRCDVRNSHLNAFLLAGNQLKVNGLTNESQNVKGFENEHKTENLSAVQTTTSSTKEKVSQLFLFGNAEEQQEGETGQKQTISHVDVPAEMPPRVLNGDGKYPCSECDYQTKFSHNLVKHYKAKHASITFDCEHCDFKSTWQQLLRNHIRVQHEGILFDCDKCSYKAKFRETLKYHKQSEHEGLTYDCDQCDYKAKRPTHLKSHKESVHEGIKYDCDQCDHKISSKSNLQKHKQTHLSN